MEFVHQNCMCAYTYIVTYTYIPLFSGFYHGSVSKYYYNIVYLVPDNKILGQYLRRPFITSNFTLFPQYTNNLGHYMLTYLNYSNRPAVAITVYKLTYASTLQV